MRSGDLALAELLFACGADLFRGNERVEVVKMFSFLVISTHFFSNDQPFTLFVIFSWTNIA